MIVTIFPDLKTTNKPIYRPVEWVLEQVRTGGKQKQLIEEIRATPDKEKRDFLKKSLGCVLFSGKFKTRSIEGLIEHSRLICIEFDHLPNVDAKKYELIQSPYTYACWLSPSGNGLRLLVEVATTNHVAHFLALTKEFPGCDVSTKDVSRIMFHSYDPEIFINRNHEVFTSVVERAMDDQQKYENLKKWLDNKGEKFVSGNRNNFLTKLAGAANRFGIGPTFLLSAVLKDYVNNTDFTKREAESTINKVYTLYADQHNTASFDEAHSDKDVKEILDVTVSTQDFIYLNDVEADLIRDYDEGTQKAPTTYFPSIDLIFRPMRGDLNVLEGIGNYGKSQMQKQMDLVRAVKDGMKFAYHTREEYPPVFWYRELIRALVGKPLERDDPERMSKAEYTRAMEFIREHFIYIYPPKLPTPKYILDRFGEACVKHSVSGCVIDPWNQLLHVMDKRDDIYLGESLTEIESFAQQMQVYMTIVAHPNRTNKKPDGNYEAPDVYDLNGGAVWNARATNITCYHRPFYQTDKSNPTAEFHSKKIKKQMLSGIPGTALLVYDRRKGRFYDNGFSPLDSFTL